MKIRHCEKCGQVPNDHWQRKLATAIEQREKLAEALEGLLADITEYQTINNLGGENNHRQVIARAALEALKEIREVCGLTLNAGCLTKLKRRTPSIYASKWERGK